MSRSVSSREVRLHDQDELDWTLPCESNVHSGPVKCREVTVKKKRVETFRNIRYGDGRIKCWASVSKLRKRRMHEYRACAVSGTVDIRTHELRTREPLTSSIEFHNTHMGKNQFWSVQSACICGESPQKNALLSRRISLGLSNPLAVLVIVYVVPVSSDGPFLAVFALTPFQQQPIFKTSKVSRIRIRIYHVNIAHAQSARRTKDGTREPLTSSNGGARPRSPQL